MRSDQDRKNNHLLLRYEQLNSDYLEQKADLTRYGLYIIGIWMFIVICFAFKIFQLFAFALMLHILALNFYQISCFLSVRYRLKRAQQHILSLQTTKNFPTDHTNHTNHTATIEASSQKHQDIHSLAGLSLELLNYHAHILPQVRLRHRRQLHEIYFILNEMSIKNTALNIHQNTDSFDVKSIQQKTFLKLQQHMQTYLNYPATERFRFQSDLKSVPDLYLSQQLNRLLQDLLTLIQPLYTDDLNTFIQHQQFNPTTPFQVYRE